MNEWSLMLSSSTFKQFSFLFQSSIKIFDQILKLLENSIWQISTAYLQNCFHISRISDCCFNTGNIICYSTGNKSMMDDNSTIYMLSYDFKYEINRMLINLIELKFRQGIFFALYPENVAICWELINNKSGILNFLKKKEMICQ